MSLTYEKLPKEPLLRTWEVNETNTRFEYYQASPSDKAMHVQFIVLSAINGLVAVTTLVVICSILTNKELRINPFNWYLVFITVPDFIMSSLCIFACAFSATISEFYSEWMCSFQSVYLTFGLCANCWMNAFIVYEVHKLLRFSHFRKRYSPPKRATVGKQASGVYLYAITWGLLGIFPIDWLPYRTYTWYGFFCFPQEYDRASTIFYWILFIPAIMGIPILYISYVCYDIWKRQLLPPRGRRRDLSVYFVRLIFVYFFMWAPAILVRILCNFWNAGAWVSWVGAVWCHLQGFVSSVVALTKPDIRRAVISFCGVSNYVKDRKPDAPRRRPRVDSDRGRGSRRSLRISMMESSIFRASQCLSPRTDANAQGVKSLNDHDWNDMSCDCADQRKSAAIPAYTTGVLSVTELSENINIEEVYLSGFEDDNEHPTQGDESEERLSIVPVTDGETGCPPRETDPQMISYTKAAVLQEHHQGVGLENVLPGVPRSDEETRPSSQTDQGERERRANVSSAYSDLVDRPATPDEEEVFDQPSTTTMGQ